MPMGFKKDGSYAGVVFKKGETGYWQGKHRNLKTKKKISISNKGK
mgnify:CR=1 FL=1